MPQTCLAEIVTLYEVAETPPAQLLWRGQQVPVVDLGRAGQVRWREPRDGSGLVAVMLGVEDRGCPYFGIALRGLGLGLQLVPEREMEDCPQEAMPQALGAFRWRNVIYQVPDLLALQEEIAGALARG
ncbi:MAG: hypothetical protein ACK5HY_00795 [Parahaliea sp.]